MARSGDLQVTKECSEYTGRAGDFCTIASSNLEEIDAGAKVIYAEAAREGTLDTDVVLDAGSGNTAKGHVVLDLATSKGTATFSGGTGTFVGFKHKPRSRRIRRRCGIGAGLIVSTEQAAPPPLARASSCRVLRIVIGPVLHELASRRLRERHLRMYFCRVTHGGLH